MASFHSSCALFLALICLIGKPAVSLQGRDKPLAAKHKDGIEIELTSENGKIQEGPNRVCALFKDAQSGSAVVIKGIRIAFSLLVGRNHGDPIQATLEQQATGGFCGTVNLGRKYYSPAIYDVTMQSIDASGKNRKVTFRISLK